MEFPQIRYFLTIHEHGGFCCSARACDVSQPSLTAAIKKLEAEIGAPMFYREGNRLLQTELGRMVKPHLERVLTGTRTAHEIAHNFALRRQTPLRIGVMTTIRPVRRSRFFRRFLQSHPGMELTVRDATLPQLLYELERGENDIAAVSTPRSGLQQRPLVDPPVNHAVLLADVRGCQRPPATKIFVEVIRSFEWPG